MRRRQFITLLGSAAAWPFAARAQQVATPVIGILGARTRDESADNYIALKEGLRDAGYVEGRNLAIEYRFAENHYERLPSLAADLVRLNVSAIVAGGGGRAPSAAKAATTTIPIVFMGGFDPVQSGLVSRLNRPGGNITGVTFAANVSESKQLGLLHAAVPAVTVIGVLVNPDNASAGIELRDLNEAAHTLGVTLKFANARTDSDLEPAIESLIQQGAGALAVAADAFFNGRIERLAALALRYALPTIYGSATVRDFAAAGGLISYGTSVAAAAHQAGIYVGRILHGEKPGDLPVMLPTRFELVINLKTAKALGIEVPPTLSAIADEVIE
jgi:putative ABC transport system substrate-binding protein